VDFSAKNMVFFTKYHGAYKMRQSLAMVSIWVRARFGGGGGEGRWKDVLQAGGINNIVCVR
jgi:hypothetical protein